MGELSVHCMLCVTSKQSFSLLCVIQDLLHGELSRPFCQRVVKPQSLLLSIRLDPAYSKAHTGYQLFALCQEPAVAQLFHSNCCSRISINLNFGIKALQKLSRKSIPKFIQESQCSFLWLLSGAVYGALCVLSSSVVGDKPSWLAYILSIFSWTDAKWLLPRIPQINISAFQVTWPYILLRPWWSFPKAVTIGLDVSWN